MRVEVQLFGSFFVTVDGVARRIQGQSERRILARLCLEPEGAVSRKVLAESLWPDTEFAVSGNRLRTGLVGLRRALAPIEALRSDRHTVALDASLVGSDAAQVLSADRAARRALGVEERAQTLTGLAEATALELLPAWDEEWAVAARVHWKQRHVEACVRRSALAVESNDLEGASAWAGRALDADPHSTEAWRLWFKALARQGRGPEAARRFFNERDRLGLKGQLWADINAAAKAARLATAKSPGTRSLTLLEAEFVQRSFARMLETDPAAAARFIAHPATGIEIEREPGWAADLIDRILDATTGTPEHAGVRTAALRARGLLYDTRALREHGEWILANDTDDSRRLGTLSVLSFDRMLARDWDRALEHAEGALAIAERLGDSSRVWRALAQRASVYWHMGRLDDALVAFREVFGGLRSEGQESSGPALARVAYNMAAILAVQGHVHEAGPWLRRSWEFSAGEDSDEMGTYLNPLGGYVSAVLGQKREAVRSLSEGVVLCMRRDGRRQLEIALDFTAGAFAVWNDGPRASALLNRVEQLRNESRHARSPAEEAFAQRLESINGPCAADPEFMSAKSTTSLAKAVLSRLESVVED